ncbi:MAG TPA: sugar ABC transporter ATP-binding protein [Candidatus Didemnitutus sp.]|nr:sugar ABC transporter ATP-binding protein [Candidatus Didemnitutus sp.]
MESAAPLLTVRGLTKRFAGVAALDGVDFTVRPGEIHALLGENGAGKSTLIKTLTGVHTPDGGEIILAGAAFRPRSPRDAENAGLSTVYQEVNLIPSLSVAENLSLGRQPGRFGFIRWRAVRAHARTVLARLDIACDPEAELGSLSLATQQLVAIARAVDLRARLLILDEPTASLDEQEVAGLFRIMRQLRTNGIGIVFVTHFLEQVYAVCDRLTILRNGRLVGEHAVRDLSRLDLVAAMLGRTPEETASTEKTTRPQRSEEPLVEARGIARRGAIRPVDVAIGAGEVVGLAGLLGSGRTETARLLFGIDRCEAGEIRVRGTPVRLDSPRAAIRLGFAFCSEDRKREGILPHLSVRENLIVALQAKRGAWKRLSRQEQEALCEHYVRALRIKLSNLDQPIATLSGGNQQKVLLARWLATRPELIIVDEPTRGIDIGAKAEIEQLIGSLRDQGVAVLFISSEIEEVVRNATEVVVLRERRRVASFSGPEVTAANLMNAMAGGHVPHE